MRGANRSREETEERCRDDERAESIAVGSRHWWQFRPVQGAILSGGLLGLGFALSRFGLIGEGAAIGFYLAAIPPGAWFWVREGVEELVREREVGIEILMAAATVGAAILGQWDEAAFLVFLYGSAEALEAYTDARTRSAIRALLDLAPKEARVLDGGRERVIPATDLQPGDVFVVRPGEGIPTDGIIREGDGALDEAAVTGESVPVEKGPGASVFAGSINRTGGFKVEATKRFEDNTLSTIIHMVEEAQERKSRTQVFIERFGRRYSPAILGVALLMLAIAAFAGTGAYAWASRAVVLLVAAAPCALVMSTPVAVAAAIGRAGRGGILIKGGTALEALGRVKLVALDKTGTLTRGAPAVTDIVVDGDHSRVLGLAAGVEYLSEHPLARAIVRQAETEGLEIRAAEGFTAHPGAGATAEIEGRTITVASPAATEARGIDLAVLDSQIERLVSEGKTVVIVSDGGTARGAIALQDEPRPEAVAALERLHGLGIRIAMLTGDNRRTAEAIAQRLGIDEIHAELKPADKVRLIEQLRATHDHVAMVGDGINDAPALAVASVGIAMGTAGTDAAIEAADVALMADDLGKMAEAIHLGRRVGAITRQNVVFSVVLLALLIPSALIGALTVGSAVLLHEVSELLAVANGVRAGRT